jgi:hypothetical protein
LDKRNIERNFLYQKIKFKKLKFFSFKGNYLDVINILNELDFQYLSNFTFVKNGVEYDSDYEKYFLYYTQLLIENHLVYKYLNYVFDVLNYHNNSIRGKFINFLKSQIIDKGTYNLKKYIEIFENEIRLRQQRIRKKKKEDKTNSSISVSNFSDYVFCPVSFVINKNYQIEEMNKKSNKETLRMKHLYERYEIYNKTKSIGNAFDDTNIDTESNETQKKFKYLFESKMIKNNIHTDTPLIFQSKDKRFVTAPDYIMEDSKGRKFTITEKFSYSNNENSHIFDNDRIKPLIHLNDIDELNLDYALIINWLWKMDGFEKKQKKIYTYFVEKFIKDKNLDLLNDYKNKFQRFKNNKTIEFDIFNDINSAKCFKCSAVSYCDYKSGNHNILKLDYDLIKIDNRISTTSYIKKLLDNV